MKMKVVRHASSVSLSLATRSRPNAVVSSSKRRTEQWSTTWMDPRCFCSRTGIETRLRYADDVLMLKDKFEVAEPRPGRRQQTLWRSFAIAGIAMHTGVISYVRVRPAFAGDGRYFVIVPLGTNKAMAYPESVDDEVVVNQELEEPIDAEAEAKQTEIFLKYLDFKQTEGFIGSFKEFITEYANLDGYEATTEADQRPQEEPVAKQEGERIIEASLENLSPNYPRFATALVNAQGDHVSSVENVLAALEACGVDNARIEIEGNHELPAVDGSALGWAIETERAGVTPARVQDNENAYYIRTALKPDRVVRVHENDAFIMIVPSNEMRLTCGIDHSSESSAIGNQWFSWSLQKDHDFKNILSAAKPYIPSLRTLHKMRQDGFLQGGSAHTVIIADGKYWMDKRLVSYPYDEPARHAILDLIGDLSLMAKNGMSGLPFGHVISYKSNHAMNHAFARELVETCGSKHSPFSLGFPEGEHTESQYSNAEDQTATTATAVTETEGVVEQGDSQNAAAAKDQTATIEAAETEMDHVVELGDSQNPAAAKDQTATKETVETEIDLLEIDDVVELGDSQNETAAKDQTVTKETAETEIDLLEIDDVVELGDSQNETAAKDQTATKETAETEIDLLEIDEVIEPDDSQNSAAVDDESVTVDTVANVVEIPENDDKIEPDDDNASSRSGESL